MTIQKTLLVILKALLAILGCLVFLFSVISPFFLTIGLLAPISNRYWSYEHDFYNGFGQHESQYWFINYWGDDVSSTMSWGLVLMFTFQLLTLTFGVGSIFFKRRILSIIPVLLCLGVLGLMIYTGNLLGLSLGEYQQGYYLVFPSLVLFIVVFILNEVLIKMSMREKK
ncbi:MAG TPA: hypothetical protein VK487_11510 [Candidatus Bathyarchaeia archaeon]|nr:hypothetical protein [Candidatus Bathyarchaeia archaeon]